MTSVKARYALKHRFKRMLSILFFGYLFFLFYITLFTHNYYVYGRSSNLVLFDSIRLMFRSGNSWLVLKNVVGNVLLFVPFGLCVPIFFRSSRHFTMMAALGIVVSTAIEFVQYYFAHRIFDIDDILLNSVGTMVGYILFVLLYLVYRFIRAIKKRLC